MDVHVKRYEKNGIQYWECRNKHGTLIAGPMTRPYEIRQAPPNLHGHRLEFGPVDDPETGIAITASDYER